MNWKAGTALPDEGVVAEAADEERALEPLEAPPRLGTHTVLELARAEVGEPEVVAPRLDLVGEVQEGGAK